MNAHPQAVHESGLSEALLQVARRTEAALGRFFKPGALRLGGGTVLQARWKHRVSTDLDFFCAPAVYLASFRVNGAEMEESLRAISDDPDHTFVDALGAYAVVDNTEVTLLPVEPPLAERTRARLPGTNIETWSSADILAAKLLHRLCGAGLAEPRDLYDLAAAAHHDALALQQAVGLLTPRQRQRAEAVLRMLPGNWLDLTDKPLLGLPADPFRIDVGSILVLLARFSQPGDAPQDP